MACTNNYFDFPLIRLVAEICATPAAVLVYV